MILMFMWPAGLLYHEDGLAGGFGVFRPFERMKFVSGLPCG